MAREFVSLPEYSPHFTLPTRPMKLRLLLCGLIMAACFPQAAYTQAPAAGQLTVRITEKLPFLDVIHNGQQVRIQRVQDTGNRLIDDYARTSRPCPPFCLHPNQIAPKVDTLGELEVLDFLATAVKSGSGLLIDTRLPEFYRAETIPTATNIPFTVLNNDNPNVDRILAALGGSKNGERKWVFQNAKVLGLFCNGAYCDSTPRAITRLLGLGYPPEKLKYYRGGMQMWRLQGLTTISAEKSLSQ